MEKSKSVENKLARKAILLLYLLVLFIPPLEAMDVMNTQWLYIALVNLFSAGYTFFYASQFNFSFSSKLSKFVFIGSGVFVLVGLLSFFKAMVVSESIVHLTMLLNTLIAFFLMYQMVKDEPKGFFDFLAILFVIFLAIESYQVVRFFLDYNVEPRSEDLIKTLPHYYGNRNILATSLVIKLIFTLYFFIKTQKLLRYLYLSVFGLGVIAILLVGTRTAIYSLPILIGVISLGYFKFLNTKVNLMTKAVQFVVPMLLTLIVSLYVALSMNKIYPNQLNSFSDLVFTKSKAAIENEKKKKRKSENFEYKVDKLVQKAGIPTFDFEGLTQKSKKKTKKADPEVNYFNDSGREVFWFSGLETLKANPVLGSSLGHWKLIEKPDLIKKKSGNGYFYPRRVHNDFLQIAYETGLLGFLLFGGFFTLVLVAVLKTIFKSDSDEDRFTNLILFCAFLAFGIDSIINFPSERPSIQMEAFAVIAFILAFVKKDVTTNFQKWGLVPILLISCGLVYGNYQMFTSSKVDLKVRDWDKGLNIFKDKYPMSYNELISRYDDFIELDGFGKPKEIAKAKFAYTEGRYQTAMNHLNRAIRLTPYQLEHMALKAVIFELNRRFRNPDSSYYYARQVYYRNPNLSNMRNILSITHKRRKDPRTLQQFLEDHKNHPKGIPQSKD